jgi:hypothetical protein
MESDTTTSGTVDLGADDAQLNDMELLTGAVNDDEDTSQTSDDSETGSPDDEDNSDEAEVRDWAAKKNLPLDDPIKMAKMYRDAEKALGKKGQREGQLKSAVSTANESSNTEDYQALKNEVEALSFYVNHPDAKQYEGIMVDILVEKPYLASDLDAVLDIAKGRSMTDAAIRLAERNAGKREARTEAEQAGRAAAPRVSARAATTSNARITPQNVDQIVGQHMGDAKWYKSHIDQINAALA